MSPDDKRFMCELAAELFWLLSGHLPNVDRNDKYEMLRRWAERERKDGEK